MVRILVIDDEEAIRLLLRDALEYIGYEVVEAGDGLEGVQCYCATPTDLVITDMAMPRQGGAETISALRRQAPSVKIIAMSGGNRTANLDCLDTARQLGAQRVFQKPFRLSEMFNAVREVLQNQVDTEQCPCMP